MRSARKSVNLRYNPATGLLCYKINTVVVPVIMSDKNEVGGLIVSVADVRVEINNAPVVRGNTITSVTLIIKFRDIILSS